MSELTLNLVNLAKSLEDVDDVEPAGHLFGHVFDGFILLRNVVVFY